MYANRDSSPCTRANLVRTSRRRSASPIRYTTRRRRSPIPTINTPPHNRHARVKESDGATPTRGRHLLRLRPITRRPAIPSDGGYDASSERNPSMSELEYARVKRDGKRALRKEVEVIDVDNDKTLLQILGEVSEGNRVTQELLRGKPGQSSKLPEEDETFIERVTVKFDRDFPLPRGFSDA